MECNQVLKDSHPLRFGEEYITGPCSPRHNRCGAVIPYLYVQFTPPARHDKTVLSVSCLAVSTESARPARQVRSASECVRRSHRQCLRRPTHSDAERTCQAVGQNQFTPPHQTRLDGPVRVASGVPV